MSVLTLDTFDISEKTGFIPENPPLTSLPQYFSKWEDAVSQLGSMLKEKRLRKTIHQLPVLDFSEKTLGSIQEWQRALVVLSYLFQGYMWQEGSDGLPSKIPSILAVPFNTITRKIGVPLVGVYAATSLYNWYKKDLEKPLTIENMHSTATYTGTEDESWFYMVTVQVELQAAPAIKAIWEGIAAREKRDNAKLASCLEVIAGAIKKMEQALKRVNEGCAPRIFFSGFLPFFSGTKGLEAGIIFEGVDSKPRETHNFTASQSSSVKAVDLYFGVQHPGANGEFLDAMIDYMPSKHREFLQHIKNQPSLRQYIIESKNDELIKQFNTAVEALASFRSYHVIMVAKYVLNQMPPSANPGESEEAPVMRKLKNMRDNTKAIAIPQ